MNGIGIDATPLNVIVTPAIELVKAKPTISYVSSQKGANAVYKFRVAANGGDMKLDQLLVDVINTTAASVPSTATLYLGNEGGTVLGTDTVAAAGMNHLTFADLSGNVNITNATYQDFTLVFPVDDRYN